MSHGMRATDAQVTLQHGKTRRSDLAVRAYRVLSGQSAYDHRQGTTTSRRFVLQRRLEAVVSVLTPAETAYFHYETGLLTERWRR